MIIFWDWCFGRESIRLFWSGHGLLRCCSTFEAIGASDPVHQ